MPIVTVLMSVYNGERYLPQAIECILSQTYTNFEFLIVDDGSTDASRDIILSYDDVRIRLLHNPTNLGLAPSLNRGIRAASGVFIARQDADDISRPQRLARQVSAMQRHPHIALLGTWYEEVDANGTHLQQGQLPCTATAIRWALFFYSPFVHTAAMLRKDMLAEVGFYDESLQHALDYELWRRIARQFPVANLDEVLVEYRIHDQSMTASGGSRTQEGYSLRVGALTELLNWHALDIPLRAERYNRMLALLFDDIAGIALAAVPRTLIDIVRLQREFCRMYRLTTLEALQHRQKLIRLVVWRLLASSHHRIHAAASLSNHHSNAKLE